MKPACSGEKSTNRSASPHRNTYRAQFQALRKNFDEEQGTVGETPQQTRGRQYGSNVNRIKNLFMQMGSEPSENAEGTTRVRGRSSLLSSEGRNKPIAIVEKADGSVVQLEASVSERISRFDAMHDESSKFTEIRKEFKRNETQPSKYCSPKKEKTISVDEQQAELCISKSSKETAQEAAMDSSSSKTEAVFPTVTELSAVFEDIDSQKDEIVSEKESSEEFTVTGHYPLNLSAVNKDLSPTVGSLDSFSPLKETSAWPLSTQNTSSVSLENSLQTPTLVNEKSKSTLPVLKTSKTQIKSASSGPSEALEQEIVVDSCDKQDMGETKAETESNASSLQKMVVEGAQNLEMPGNPVLIDDSAFHIASFSVEDRSEREMQKEQEDFQSSHGSGHTHNNVHKIESIYNFDWEAGTEEDDQEDNDGNNTFIMYHKEYFEISGLSEEEEIPSTRKIKFSTAPIK
ncbi:Neurabin-1, partial [Ophiophagus hannah]